MNGFVGALGAASNAVRSRGGAEVLRKAASTFSGARGGGAPMANLNQGRALQRMMQQNLKK